MLFGQNPLKTSFEFHRFYLKEPVKELLEIRYEDSCKPADGRLMPDGKSILIKHYTGHKRMYVRFLRTDGEEIEMTQSPCYIDPVVGEL